MRVEELRRRLLDRLPADRIADTSGSVAGVPVGVVARARSTREVAQILACAQASQASVVVRGAGTKIDWGAAPRSVDLLLDLSGLSAIIEHVPGDLVVHTQAGTPLAALRTVLAGCGQRLALDEVVPGSTVGGVIATALAGPLRFAFGLARDLLIGVTAVRSDGTITHSGGKVVKNVAGYDLGKLYTGSYGTLAVVTSAVFRLHPAPEAAAFVVARPDDLGRALATLRHSQAALSAVEVDCGPGQPFVVALVEGRRASVRARAAQVARDIGGDAQVSERPPAGFGELCGATTAKLTCRLSGVAALIDDIAGLQRVFGVPITVRGSAGAGVLYAGWDAATPSGLIEALRAACGRRRGFAVVLRTTDADRARLPLWGPAPGLSLMRRIKAEFDPAGLLAPGRFVGGI